MIQIRRAQAHDIPWLLGELKKFSVFFTSKYPLFPDDEYAAAQLINLMNIHPFFVAVNETGCVGFIMGVLQAHFFNPQILSLTELFWWVQEEHRHSRAGLMLLLELIEFGKQNAQWITITLEHNSPVNPTTLIKRGFHLHESAYLMEI